MAYWDLAASNTTYWALSGVGEPVGTRIIGDDYDHTIQSRNGNSSGKKYFEIHFTKESGSHQFTGIGVVTAAGSNSNMVGINPGSWGWINGKFQSESSSVSTSIGYPGIDATYGFIVDLDAGKAWLTILGDIYGGNGSNVPLSNADVEAGLDPCFESANLIGVELFPAATMYFTPQTATLKLTEAEQTYTPPSGYSAWSEPVASPDQTILVDLALGIVGEIITQKNSIPVNLALSVGGNIQTNYSSVHCNLGLSVTGEMATVKMIDGTVSLGLSVSGTLNSPSPIFSGGCNLALSIVGEMVSIPINTITVDLGLGVKATTFKESDMQANVNLALSATGFLFTESIAPCSLPTHDSTRWS